MKKLAVWTAGLALALGACSDANREERRWTEDVKLDDSTTVQIERHVVFEETDALGGGAYNAVETKATLEFTGENSSLPAWDFPRIALVLYRSKETAKWRIVATSSSCEVWRAEGRPRPPYYEYELEKDGWRKTALSPESLGRTPNLFFRYKRDDFGKHVTPRMKEAQFTATLADKYRHIIADPKDFGCM